MLWSLVGYCQGWGCSEAINYEYTVCNTRDFVQLLNRLHPHLRHLFCKQEKARKKFLQMFSMIFLQNMSTKALLPKYSLTHRHTRIYIYIYISSSSSSSCRAAITDILDPLSPLLPIIHRLWQVFRATSRILP